MVTDPSARGDPGAPMWRLLLDRAPIAVALLSVPYFVYEYANEAMLALAPGRDIVGQRYCDVWPESASVTDPLLRRVAETGEEWHGDDVGWWLAREPGGPLEYRLFNFTLERLDGPDATHLVLTAKETTEDVQRCEAARGEGIRLEEVLESVTDAFFTLDYEWRFTYLNARAANLLRRDRDELLGGNVWELFPEAVGTVFWDEYHEVMELHVRRSFEAYYEPLDLMIEVRAYPTIDGLAVLFTEIADRVATQRRLAESELLFRSVFDNAGVGIGQVTRDGVFVRVNQAYAAMLRYTPEEMTELTFQDVTYPDDLDADLALAEEVAEGLRESYALEKRYVAKDGTIVPTILTVSGVRDLRGDLQYFIAVVEDISFRREAENRALAELERTRLLKDVASAAASSMGIREIAGKVLDALNTNLGAHLGSVYHLDRDTNTLRQLALFGYPPEAEALFATLPFDDSSWVGYTLVNGLPYLTDDTAPASDVTRHRAEIAEATNDRWIMLPLQAKGELLGALVLSFHVRRSFTDAEISLYRAVADLLAVAVENGRLFEAQVQAGKHARRELDLANLLLESAGILSASVDITDVLGEFAELTLRFVRHDRVTIHLYDRERDELVIATSRGREAAASGGWSTLDDISEPMRRVLTQGTPEVVDYEALPSDERGRAPRFGTLLGLLVPLVAAGDLVGLVIVDDPNTRREFTQREIELATAVSAQAAVAIRNSQLYAEVTERARLTDLLAEVDAITHSTLDSDEVMRRTVSWATEGLKAEGGAIELLEDDGWSVRYASSDDIPTGRPLTDKALIAELITQSVHPVTVEDGWSDPRFDTNALRQDGIRAVLGIPLVLRARLAGVLLFFERSESRRYSAAELDFAEKLAASVSLALENARLYEQARERVRLGDSLVSIDAVVHSSLDVDEVVKGALADGARTLGAHSAAIDGVESDGWVTWYDYGFQPSIVGHTLTNAQNPQGVLAVSTGETVAVDDTWTDPRVDAETAKAYGLRAVIVAPLIVRGRGIAAIYYNFKERPHRFTKGEIQFVANVASSLSLAIENSRLFQQERRVARLNEALSTVNQLLLSTLSPDELLGRVVAEASRVVGADKGVVVEIDGADFVFTHTYGYPTASARTRVARTETPIMDLAVRSQRPQLVEDVSTEERVDQAFYEPYGINAFMVLPLVVQGGVLGALALQYATPQQFDESSIELAQRMSTALSLALENARRYETERTIAETLQETLVLLPQHVAGVEFAQFYQSASDTGRVGGDFIDIFEIRDGKVAVTLGDVSGKGLSAASLTATVRNTIRAYAIEGLPPVAVISHTNEITRRFSSTETFVTLMYAVIDTRSGVIRFVNAGHPAGVVVRDGHVTDHLGPGNSIVGAFEQVGFSEGRSKLGAGDCLVLFSDGVTEARRDGELFGDAGVAKALSECKDESPDEVVQALHDAVLAWARGELRDDVAILAVRRTWKKARPSDDEMGPVV